jgi:hypothetical protein
MNLVTNVAEGLTPATEDHGAFREPHPPDNRPRHAPRRNRHRDPSEPQDRRGAPLEIMDKLNLHDRDGLARFAIREGLVEL